MRGTTELKSELARVLKEFHASGKV